MTTLQQDEDGVWVAECPAIPGCVSQGMTREEASRNLKEAMQSCLEVRKEKGMPLTVETREIELSVARVRSCRCCPAGKSLRFFPRRVGWRVGNAGVTSFSQRQGTSPHCPFPIIGRWPAAPYNLCFGRPVSVLRSLWP